MPLRNTRNNLDFKIKRRQSELEQLMAQGVLKTADAKAVEAFRMLASGLLKAPADH